MCLVLCFALSTMCWDHANLLCFVKSWTKCRSTMTVEGKQVKIFAVYVPNNTQAMTMRSGQLLCIFSIPTMIRSMIIANSVSCWTAT